MKKIVALTILACLTMATTSQGQYCTTIDFEDIATTTPVFGDYAISALFSIYGDEPMEVVEEGAAVGVLAYNANVGGTANSVANWLPGNNAKSFGNASSVREATSQDLTIIFNPNIVVESFALDLFDFGDWFPIGGTDPREATLTAYASDDSVVDTDILSLDYTLAHDVWDLWDSTGVGARNLSVAGVDIAYVEVTFADLDPGMTFDNIEICYIPMCDSATGMGTPILDKGNWFMYNTYPEGSYDIQAGNPKNGPKIIGSYDVTDNGNDTYTVTYDINPTIEIDGLVYNIVVTDEHLAISDAADFAAKPGKDDNADFGVAFPDADGDFYIFAHFEVEYQL